jgi:NAD(P)-dependent dehydrogenase (short-subunit alcohol dehydrogenase family)
VVVTGASSGIGWGTVSVLISHGFRVFGSVRKRDDADRLQTEFGTNFTPIVFDVTDEAAVRAGAEQVRSALGGKRLGGLVNNAGVALGGPLIYMSPDIFRKQLDINLVGVLLCTQAFAPLLGADPALQGAPGRIVNIGSIGGRTAYPFMGPYHTSKFGLEGFTESLRRELMIFGIDATLVTPGSVVTEIWDKADKDDYSEYDNTAYRGALAEMRKQVAGVASKGLRPERVGEIVFRQLVDAKPRTRRTVTPDPFTLWAMTNLPKRMIDGVIAKRLKLETPTPMP